MFLLFTWAHVELTIVRGEGVQVWGIGGGFGKGLSGNRGGIMEGVHVWSIGGGIGEGFGWE